MNQEEVVLCAASAYDKKYYFNEDFNQLPDEVKDELKAVSVLFTEDIGGILILQFTEDGSLELKTEADEGDVLFDDIGSGLKIRQLQRDKAELFEAIEMFYRVFFLNEDVSEE